ncbi:MAG: SusC/RagA family TonB-linked outer membrane protein [Gemmatimonadota bacterium]
MNLLRRFAAVAALAAPLALSSGLAAQQTGTITGQVVDAANAAPLVGVQMVLQGTNIGTLTNENGRYLITNVPVGTQTVRAVTIGYAQISQDVTVSAGQTAVADFQLSVSAVNLDAIVVSAATGREQRLREVGTNVATIEAEDLNPAPITSVADVLSGRTEGVILQDVNGATGTSQRIRIRGTNSISLSNEPLVFVDGVQVNSSFGGFGVGGQEPSRLNDLNPNDIANIEIIKGPAASATYGTAAANGVILITTKRGAPGATQWQFFAETGVQNDVTDYPGVYAAYQIDDATQPLFTEDGFFNTAGYSYCSNINAALNACNQDETLYFNTLLDPRTRMFSEGNRNRFGASVRGGNESLRFFVSGQYEDEQGVVYYNTQEKLNLRANLDAALAESLDLGISVGYTDGDLGLNSNDNSIFSPIINGLIGEPYYIPEDPEIEGPNPDNYGFGFNLNQLSNFITNQETDRFTTAANLRWRPTNWLSINANGGLDFTSLHDNDTVQRDVLPIAVSWAAGFRESQRSTRTNYTGILSAVGTFALTDDLVSTTTAGTQYTEENNRNTYCYGAYLVPGTFSCGTTSDLFSVDEDFFQVKTLGIYAQQEFGWRDRIFAGFSIRGDNTSTFGTNLGFQYFPSANLSWVISDESFMPSGNLLSTLRVRGAWGQSGLRPGFRDAVTLYAPTTVALDGGDAAGVALSVTGNEQLKQETTTEWEVGFDAGFFNNRLSAEFTYFDRKSEDALISRNLPASLGLTTSVFQNLGSISNSGTELSLRFDVVQAENFGVNVGFNNTTIKNRIDDLGEGIEDIIFNRGLQRHAEGYTAGGFWQQPVTWDDADGNGLLDLSEVTVADEAEFIGPAIPTWQRSLFADIRLFNFITVSTLVEGRGGHYTGNDSEAFRCGRRTTRGCAAVGDPTASLREQAAYIADRFGGATGSNSAYLYVERADFWRWRELSVTFDMPRAFSNRVSALEGLRLTVAGRNLGLLTDYSGLDPETVEGGGNANFSQSEFNTQPPVRYFMIRLDYNF